MRKLTFTPLAWSFTLFSQESSAWILICSGPILYFAYVVQHGMLFRLLVHVCTVFIGYIYMCKDVQSTHIHEIYRIFVWSLYLCCLHFVGSRGLGLLWAMTNRPFWRPTSKVGMISFFCWQCDVHSHITCSEHINAWKYNILSWQQQDLGLLFVLGQLPAVTVTKVEALMKIAKLLTLAVETGSWYHHWSAFT